MSDTYSYTIEGIGGGGQTWTVNGEVTAEKEGGFPGVVSAAQLDAFMKLTNGKAIYGKPGLGCNGPYKITKFLIERHA